MDQASLREMLAGAYAAGALGPSLALMVETQAALSGAAARAVSVAETTAGALLEREIPAALRQDALERVFAQIAQLEDAEKAPAPRAARNLGGFLAEMAVLPAPVREPAMAAFRDKGWTFSGFGIRTLTLDLEDGVHAELIRIEPGVATPKHTHGGEEYTLVLTGAFHDERGRYGVGDIAVAGPGITHRPTAETGEVCWNFAVSEAPLQFTGLLGALQKMMKH